MRVYDLVFEVLRFSPSYTQEHEQNIEHSPQLAFMKTQNCTMPRE